MDAMHIEASTVGGRRCEFDLEPSCTWNEMRKKILVAFGHEDAHPELLTLVAGCKQLEAKVGTDPVSSLGMKPGTILTAVIGDPEELEKKLISLSYSMSAFDILEDAAVCRALANKVRTDESTPHELIEHLLPVIKAFALHREGCRLVQAILEKGGPRVSTIVEHLVDIFEDLYESPNGNHVLTRAILLLPPASSMGMVRKVEGRAATVARHRYGCRVLERLIENVDEPQLRFVLQEIVADASSLCRHPYGNFVIQSMLERVEWSRTSILQEVLNGGCGMPYLASHRTASHVVQKALEYCDKDGQHQIIEALLGQGGGSLLRVATSRYGSYVIEQLNGLSGSCSTLVAAVEIGLRNSQETLRSTPYGCRVAHRFGLQAAADIVPGGDAAQGQRGA